MNYELAKELKDAGFPQPNTNPNLTGKILFNPDKASTASWIAYAPTLSELIEACGDRLDDLSRMHHFDSEKKWGASAYSCEECGFTGTFITRGATPEEAVARLWLALNKKD
jgi:hypothetical protein